MGASVVSGGADGGGLVGVGVTTELNEDRYMKAYVQRELGKACLDAGNQPGAQEAFAHARQGFQQLGMTLEVQATDKLLVKLNVSPTI